MCCLPVGLARDVAERYAVDGAATPIIDGGDECEIWCLDSSPRVVVRISPAWRSVPDIAFSHRVAIAFGTQVPEATCPMVGRDGTTVFEWNGRPVSVWPFVDGPVLDRENAALRIQAAGLLARLHQAAQRLALEAAEPRTAPADPANSRLPDEDLDTWLTGWRSAPAACGPAGLVHGDFYRRNILCQDGRIVGLIDWDDVHHDLLIADLAWAVWELAKSPDGTMLLDRVEAFLAAYERAGGLVRRSDAVVPLIRAHLRYEVDRAEQAKVNGKPMDAGYQAAEIAAFQLLRDIELSR
jgi:Ser/Thr protein kinase RdoA (MazF antagonist)